MMKTRMQPIGNILGKFNRVVRDLSKELHKKIDLQIVGADTELDKTLLEAVKDPLTHIVRNSCDHGIETPEERRSKNKSENGTITMRAYHESGQVIVEIADDGKGLHRDKILAKAIEKNLISPDKASQMSDREVMNLIFAPGFSTAAQVTNVSGRGVGMDVVRSNIDRIGGTVEIESQPDRGTRICLKIPLTLAIVPAMIVRAGMDQYAIPQIKLVELVRVEKGSSEHKIEDLQGKPVLRLRGNLLPLVDIKGVLKFPEKKSESAHVSDDAINIVVLNSGHQYFGLIVDEIQDTADIVVKPLSRFLKPLAVYSGATVLGDGSIALILDVAGIASLTLQSSGAEKTTGANFRETNQNAAVQDLQEYLLFRLNSPTVHAFFLGYVHRLEEFKREQIELSGGNRVIRYRGQIIQVVSLNEHLGYPVGDPKTETTQKPSDVVSVIVTQKGDRLFGVEVNEILDVLSTELDLDTSLSDRPAILGNLAMPNEVIVVIDPHRCLPEDLRDQKPAPRVQLVQDTFSEVAEITQRSMPKVSRKSPQVGGTVRALFAEDTAFFRKRVVSLLERDGYEVVTVKNGEEALMELEKRDPSYYGVILSDIEMPKLNGYGLARAIRKDPKWKTVPLVALTSLGTSQDRQNGLDAGFDLYLEKLNGDELLVALSELKLAKGA
jgi:two-component system chemotaxis sensor kinase CheA